MTAALQSGVPSPNSMEIVGALVRAFDSSKDAPAEARCLLRSKTTQRGFRGECETRRWCCPLTALITHLVQRELVRVPSPLVEDEKEARTFLFGTVALELICWMELPEAERTANLTAHFQLFVTELASRVGAAASIAGQLPSFLCPEPAWADRTRRAEPLRLLLQEQGITQRELANKLGCYPNVISSWMAGARPRLESFVLLEGYGKRIGRPALGWEWRWHYALAQLADSVASRLGESVVVEAVRVFHALASCRARALHAGIQSGKVDVLDAGALAFNSLHAVDGIDLAGHAGAHGASVEFVERVRDVAPVWRSVLAVAGDSAETSQLTLLLTHLPRRPS